MMYICTHPWAWDPGRGGGGRPLRTLRTAIVKAADPAGKFMLSHDDVQLILLQAGCRLLR